MRNKTLTACAGISIYLLLCMLSLPARHVSAAGSTYWRLVHASPDITTADVYVDGVPLVTNFKYGSVTGYVPTTPGTHKFQVAFVGKGIGAAVITQDITVSPNVPYTVAILGTKSSGYAVKNIVDDNSSVSGMVKVRAYQFASDAGPVNVTTNSGTIASGLTYQQASGYSTVSPGMYTIKATAVQSNTTVSNTAALNAGTLSSVFTIGLLHGNPQLSIVTSQATIIPGMPQTGSDPNAPSPAQPAPIWPWWGMLPVAIMTAGFLLFQRRRVRHKAM